MSGHVRSNRPIHIGTPDTTQTGPSCRVWRGGVNWAFVISEENIRHDSQFAYKVQAAVSLSVIVQVR